MNHFIPNDIDEITPEWLTQVLTGQGIINSKVLEARHSKIGDDVGLLSKVVRTQLTYENPTGKEPDALVVKIEPSAGAFLDSANKAHVFAREIRFYEEIASQVPIRVPKYYYGDVDERGGVLILEDLTRLKQHSQIVGLPNANVLAAVRQCAKLHAHFWGRDSSEGVDWIPRDDGRLFINVEAQWEQFEALYGLRIGEQAVELGRWLSQNILNLQRIMAERIHTVCHADFRADNLLFGEPGTADEVVIYDWQLATRAMGALDVSRLVGGSEPEQERRVHPLEALSCWHEELTSNGVQNYSIENAMEDFRIAAIANLAVPVRLCLLAEQSDGRLGRLVDVMAERLFASALEVEAWKVLP
jgi:hypothetical protein|tara:strand:- start:713 stop:1786 length:1074 start_codon:yes stop_codon:yes gene_type:complete